MPKDVNILMVFFIFLSKIILKETTFTYNFGLLLFEKGSPASEVL